MFGYIQQLLQAFQARSQKRSSYLLRMEEISPYLAKIKSSAIYMPGQTQFSSQVSLYHICSIALYCTGCVVITVLCCEMWWCAVLKCAVLYMLCGNVLSYIVLHCIVIYCIVLYCIIFYYMVEATQEMLTVKSNRFYSFRRLSPLIQLLVK